MSRHEIPTRDPSLKVVVGWDRPLLTYFVQVIDLRAKDPDDNVIQWVGTFPREIYEVEKLARIVGPYAELTPELRSILYGDKDEGR